MLFFYPSLLYRIRAPFQVKKLCRSLPENTGQQKQGVDLDAVTGKSADFARQMLSAAGLNCVVEGNANGTVQAQSADPGSSVQRGTVVTITCG